MKKGEEREFFFDLDLLIRSSTNGVLRAMTTTFFLTVPRSFEMTQAKTSTQPTGTVIGVIAFTLRVPCGRDVPRQRCDNKLPLRQSHLPTVQFPFPAVYVPVVRTVEIIRNVNRVRSEDTNKTSCDRRTHTVYENACRRRRRNSRCTFIRLSVGGAFVHESI